jgi:4-alpha-glucanotransferase
MNVTFRIRYSTQVGQTLWLSGNAPLPAHPVPMQYLDSEFWQVSLPLTKAVLASPLNYSYIVRHPNGLETVDWGRERMLVPAEYNCQELLVVDAWNHAGYYENAFYTEPFKRVLLAEKFTEVPAHQVLWPTHTFRVKAPLLPQGQTLCLLGEGHVFHHWNPQAPILLSRQPGENDYTVRLNLNGQPFPIAYKYGVYDVSKDTFIRFEDGQNRSLRTAPEPNQHVVINDGFAVLPADTWHGAGVAIPVFSLRSEKSFGVGEFADLKHLADWGKSVGLKLIQLLPINDTGATNTWKDSYPYAAISAFALHPIYLNLEAVAHAKNKSRLKELEPERERLNALDSVDYEAVMKTKLAFLREIFPSQKTAAFRAREFKAFFKENAHWLVPYAAFCVLRDKFGTSDFSQWPEYSAYSEENIAAFAKNNDEVAFHYFLQYHLHLQLQEATAHCHANGLVVKGDIAIGVYRHGADTWQAPELYHMDQQAGAPPDPFSDKGQNWGFPTYNWRRMAADGFTWWKRRFAQMGCYFDAFRIDHILGFFRIWSSPAHAVEGILGHFVPAIPLEVTEFAARGIPFDRDRYLKPFINDAVLDEVLGTDAAVVRRDFLLADGKGGYALKPEFATQRQVESHFASQPQNERNLKLKTGLFDLTSNVILLEAEGKLHFRFGIEKTSSFKHLPADVQPKLRDLYVDYFFRRQDDFWMREAMQKLPALKRVTNMLICGEDLGLVPACVPDVMKDLGFLSLEIQRMPKVLGTEFSRPATAPYLSVVTPSTHDMSTIRGWWAEDSELTQKFFNHELGLTGEAPAVATPENVEAVIRQHLASPAMWSIFQLQDLLGMDGELRRADVDAERINVPANPNHYWRYRIHLTLEKLMTAKKFNEHLGRLMQTSGR